MMEKNRKIEEEIDKTLQCFEMKENIEADPYFYSRLKARMKSVEKRRDFRWGWSFGLMLLLVLNIFTVVYFMTDEKTADYNRDELLTAFGREYSLAKTQNDFY